MESDSVLSEPPITQNHRGLSLNGDRSSSMTILSPTASTISGGQPRMAQLETLEAKMASIEVSLSSAAAPRRRKGTSLGGVSISTARSSPSRPDSSASRELRTAVQDREAVIQNLRVQLGLNKLPRPAGTPLEENERPVAEQKLARLKIDADNKKIAIRNLRQALDKLDITDNIDVRIRQAELEYALGREELQLLSLVEEGRALQARIEKSKPEANTLFATIQSGANLSLHAVSATVGRWSASPKTDSPGLWIEWALDGEGLYRGDRIIELNGKLVTSRTREELQRLLGNGNSNNNNNNTSNSNNQNGLGKCQLVVARKKIIQSYPHQQLMQSQEDNLRLQHRISYLEDQVKELLSTKLENGDTNGHRETNGKTSSHVTSISISSPPVTPPIEKPQIFQRGNFVTTIIGGKAVDEPPPSAPTLHNNGPTKNHNVTKTIIKENHKNGIQTNGHHHNHHHHHMMNGNSISASSISINSDLTTKSSNSSSRRDRHLYNNRETNNNYEKHRYSETPNHTDYYGYSNGYSHARSVEHLNYTNSTNNNERRPIPTRRTCTGTDLRSVKSLDFESDGGNNTDYASEPTGPRIRPTPPKKPLRLSLQRAQSLQTVEGSILELEKKRASKRTHKGDKMCENIMQYIENNGGSTLQTTSLGRSKHV